jgi:hypothetical protein
MTQKQKKQERKEKAQIEQQTLLSIDNSLH